jgi:hypothetical protein
LKIGAGDLIGGRCRRCQSRHEGDDRNLNRPSIIGIQFKSGHGARLLEKLIQNFRSLLKTMMGLLLSKNNIESFDSLRLEPSESPIRGFCCGK